MTSRSLFRTCNTFVSRACASCRQRLRFGDRGAALVEFGLIAPIFFALILGGITTGLSYNSNNSLNNGARETARYAATLPVGAGIEPWLNEIADTAIASTAGNLASTTAGQQICVAYVHPDGTEIDDTTVLLLEQGGGRQILPGRACFADGRPNSERRIQVVLGRDSEIQTILYNRTVGLEARSVVRFERAG